MLFIRVENYFGRWRLDSQTKKIKSSGIRKKKKTMLGMCSIVSASSISTPSGTIKTKVLCALSRGRHPFIVGGSWDFKDKTNLIHGGREWKEIKINHPRSRNRWLREDKKKLTTCVHGHRWLWFYLFIYFFMGLWGWLQSSGENKDCYVGKGKNNCTTKRPLPVSNFQELCVCSGAGRKWPRIKLWNGKGNCSVYSLCMYVNHV